MSLAVIPVNSFLEDYPGKEIAFSLLLHSSHTAHASLSHQSLSGDHRSSSKRVTPSMLMSYGLITKTWTGIESLKVRSKPIRI